MFKKSIMFGGIFGAYILLGIALVPLSRGEEPKELCVTGDSKVRDHAARIRTLYKSGNSADARKCLDQAKSLYPGSKSLRDLEEEIFGDKKKHHHETPPLVERSDEGLSLNRPPNHLWAIRHHYYRRSGGIMVHNSHLSLERDQGVLFFAADLHLLSLMDHDQMKHDQTLMVTAGKQWDLQNFSKVALGFTPAPDFSYRYALKTNHKYFYDQDAYVGLGVSRFQYPEFPRDVVEVETGKYLKPGLYELAAFIPCGNLGRLLAQLKLQFTSEEMTHQIRIIGGKGYFFEPQVNLLAEDSYIGGGYELSYRYQETWRIVFAYDQFMMQDERLQHLMLGVQKNP